MASEIDMDATVPVKLMLKSSLKSPETGLEVPQTVSSVTITLFPEFNSASVEKTLVPPRATSRDGTSPALLSNVISHLHWSISRQELHSLGTW